MIAVVDYGAGNIRSVVKALETVGAHVTVSYKPESISKAEKIVLPGVGHFGKAVESLKERGLFAPLQEAIHQGKAFLGICLGFQLLFPASQESAGAQGLGCLKGSVEHLPNSLKVPHLGWNRVRQPGDSPLWAGIPEDTYFYFAHSYYVRPEEKRFITGSTEYGGPFTSAMGNEMLFGVQFHPEKSQRWGLLLLENFVQL
ncbi:imidazole glycerol phosphate synthase subunit HisH [bacterium]